ncbi:MAG TPA: class I SAM-dependent methyltransferase [Herpetosiphonaceae bacterium]|nr:class I SAM-dependent methyltransferase [Herpetosiphonaceae bacterium]
MNDHTEGCHHCGSAEYRVVFSGPDRQMDLAGRFTFVECRQCGLFYQHPRPTWAQLAPHYEGEYNSYYRALADDPNPIRRAIHRLGPLKQRRYVEKFAAGGALLDIGCGTGTFLEEMQRSAARWRLYAIEPTRSAAEYVGQRFGIPVLNTTFEAASFQSESLDAVCMWNVFEHLERPFEALDRIHAMLKPGGVFVFALPNYESLARAIFGKYWLGWDLPRHLYIFPEPIIRQIAASHGFEVVDKSCFSSTYKALEESLKFWMQSWPGFLQGLGRLIIKAYAHPAAHVALLPLLKLTEKLNKATVITWSLKKK